MDDTGNPFKPPFELLAGQGASVESCPDMHFLQQAAEAPSGSVLFRVEGTSQEGPDRDDRYWMPGRYREHCVSDRALMRYLAIEDAELLRKRLREWYELHKLSPVKWLQIPLPLSPDEVIRIKDRALLVFRDADEVNIVIRHILGVRAEESDVSIALSPDRTRKLAGMIGGHRRSAQQEWRRGSVRMLLFPHRIRLELAHETDGATHLEITTDPGRMAFRNALLRAASER